MNSSASFHQATCRSSVMIVCTGLCRRTLCTDAEIGHKFNDFKTTCSSISLSCSILRRIVRRFCIYICLFIDFANAEFLLVTKRQVASYTAFMCLWRLELRPASLWRSHALACCYLGKNNTRICTVTNNAKAVSRQLPTFWTGVLRHIIFW